VLPPDDAFALAELPGADLLEPPLADPLNPPVDTTGLKRPERFVRPGLALD
jgi:hypothetical protein